VGTARKKFSTIGGTLFARARARSRLRRVKQKVHRIRYAKLISRCMWKCGKLSQEGELVFFEEQRRQKACTRSSQQENPLSDCTRDAAMTRALAGPTPGWGESGAVGATHPPGSTTRPQVNVTPVQRDAPLVHLPTTTPPKSVHCRYPSPYGFLDTGGREAEGNVNAGCRTRTVCTDVVWGGWPPTPSQAGLLGLGSVA